jgi:hypothetical protein
MPLPRLTSYVCPDCGVWIRDVETTWGETVTLNAARDPNGRIVPWPAESLNGAAVARILPAGVRAEDGRTWSVHACNGIPGNGLFREQPTHFGTRVMFSDARNEEFVYEECPGSHTGHKALPLLLKYADWHTQHAGNFYAGTNEDDMTVFIFLPDPGQPGQTELQVLYNHDPDHVVQTLKTHGRHWQWIPDLGLAHLDDPLGKEELLSFSLNPVKPCSLPLEGKR